jgi:uncharacterized protein (DUF3820 family)
MSRVKLTDNDIMPFGYYGKLKTKMANVPASYLLWVKNTITKPKNDDERAVLLYIKENWSVIKTEIERERNK